MVVCLIAIVCWTAIKCYRMAEEERCTGEAYARYRKARDLRRALAAQSTPQLSETYCSETSFCEHILDVSVNLNVFLVNILPAMKIKDPSFSMRGGFARRRTFWSLYLENSNLKAVLQNFFFAIVIDIGRNIWATTLKFVKIFWSFKTRITVHDKSSLISSINISDFCVITVSECFVFF